MELSFSTPYTAMDRGRQRIRPTETGGQRGTQREKEGERDEKGNTEGLKGKSGTGEREIRENNRWEGRLGGIDGER